VEEAGGRQGTSKKFSSYPPGAEQRTVHAVNVNP
jgi:hypothetical protein